MVTAPELYERTLADYERVLGPHHENTLTSRANLAIAYHAAHRTPDAIALFRRTLSDCEQALPPDHPLTQSRPGEPGGRSPDADGRTLSWRPCNDSTGTCWWWPR